MKVEVDKDTSNKSLSASEAQGLVDKAKAVIPELIVKYDILGNIRSQARGGQDSLHLGYSDDEHESLLIEWKLARDYLRDLGYSVIYTCSRIEETTASVICENEPYHCKVTISWSKPWWEDE